MQTSLRFLCNMNEGERNILLLIVCSYNLTRKLGKSIDKFTWQCYNMDNDNAK